ncbi:hypothetical protein TWF281_006923 [Arthrobotrys megalospora]
MDSKARQEEPKRSRWRDFLRPSRTPSNVSKSAPTTPRAQSPNPEPVRSRKLQQPDNRNSIVALASAVGGIVIPSQSATNTTVPNNTSPHVSNVGIIGSTPATTTTLISPPATAPSPASITPTANSPKSLDLWREAAGRLQESERRHIDDTNLRSAPWKSVVDDLIVQTENLREISRQKAWKIKWGDHTIVLRDIAEKTVSWLQKFKEVGDIAVQYDPAHASLPWAGVRFLLQVIVSDFEGREAILIGIETVTRVVTRFTAYEEMYIGAGLQHEDALREGLVGLYVLILRFLIKSKEFFEASIIKHIGKAIVPEVYSKELDILETAEQEAMKDIGVAAAQQTRLRDTSTSQKLEKLQGLVEGIDGQFSRLDKTLEKIVDNLNETERGEALAWASPINHNSQHEFVVDTITSGTCTWLHKEPGFTEWRNSSSSSVFWLRGDPGCGKTRLTSSVIRLLLDETKSRESIAYFYCDGKTGDESRTDPRSIICSLLKQMASLQPGQPLQPALAKAYKERVGSGNKASPPSFKEAKQIISEINGDQLYSRITIVIDALDECNKEYRGDLVEALVELVQASNTLVKIFFSSRPHEEDLNLQLGKVLKYCINLSDTSADVELFIDQTMSEYLRKDKFLPRLLQGQRDIVVEQVVTVLKEKCRGMFLWADLQMKDLCRLKSRSQVTSCLAKLPLDLHSTYQRIFDKILQDEFGQRVATTAFQWILGTVRPLRLGELVGAIQEKTQDMDLTLDSVLEMCQNLLVLDQTEDVIRFIHLSAVEFLQNTENLLPGFSFQTGECLNSVTLDCLAHLSSERSRRFNPDLLSSFWVQYHFFLYDLDGSYNISERKQDLKLNPVELSSIKNEFRPDLEFTTFVWEQWPQQLRQSTDQPDEIFDALKGFLGLDACRTKAGNPDYQTNTGVSVAFRNMTKYGNLLRQQFEIENAFEMKERTRVLTKSNEHGRKWGYNRSTFNLWACKRTWNGFGLLSSSIWMPNFSPFLLACCIGMSRYIQWSYRGSQLVREFATSKRHSLSALCILKTRLGHRFCRETFEAILDVPNFTTTESEIVNFLWLMSYRYDTETWLFCVETVIRRHIQFRTDPFCVARWALYSSCRRPFGDFTKIFSALGETSKYPSEILMGGNTELSLDLGVLQSWLIYGLEDAGNAVRSRKDCGGFQKYLPTAPLYIVHLSLSPPKDFVKLLQFWLEKGINPNHSGLWGSLCHFLVLTFVNDDSSGTFKDVFDLLVLHQAEIDIKHPVTGETPLEYAYSFKCSPQYKQGGGWETSLGRISDRFKPMFFGHVFRIRRSRLWEDSLRELLKDGHEVDEFTNKAMLGLEDAILSAIESWYGRSPDFIFCLLDFFKRWLLRTKASKNTAKDLLEELWDYRDFENQTGNTHSSRESEVAGSIFLGGWEMPESPVDEIEVKVQREYEYIQAAFGSGSFE